MSVTWAVQILLRPATRVEAAGVTVAVFLLLVLFIITMNRRFDARNHLTCRYRQRVLDRIFRASERYPEEAIDLEISRRLAIFYSVSYGRQVCSVWRPVWSFYSGSEIAEMAVASPNGVVDLSTVLPALALNTRLFDAVELLAELETQRQGVIQLKAGVRELGVTGDV